MDTAARTATGAEAMAVPQSEERDKTGARRPRAATDTKAETMVHEGVREVWDVRWSVWRWMCGRDVQYVEPFAGRLQRARPI